MPLVNGKYLHWWHWTAKDPNTGSAVIIFTDGGPGIATKDQLLVVVKQLFPFLDYSSFTAELTEKIGEAFQRKPVPQKYVATPWQREMNQFLAPPAPPLAQRSILYGTRESEKRQHHAPQRSGRVSKLYPG
jgi:hypothetical protein